LCRYRDDPDQWLVGAARHLPQRIAGRGDGRGRGWPGCRRMVSLRVRQRPDAGDGAGRQYDRIGSAPLLRPGVRRLLHRGPRVAPLRTGMAGRQRPGRRRFGPMNLRSSLIVVSLLGGLLLQGCGVSPTRPQAAREESSTPLVRANYRAAESLLEQLRYSLPLKQGAILIGTLVNIDALDRSSTFGRLTTDQISARFTMAGYPMVEMKLRNSAYMLRDQAELMLSREVGDLISSHNAQAVIVGTYAVSRD